MVPSILPATMPTRTRARFFIAASLPFWAAISCTSAPADLPPPVEDAGPGEVCPLRPPLVGQSAETMQLAGAAAHCGVPAFAWRSDKTLGDVVEKGLHDHFTADALGVLLALSHVTPQGPVHEVDLDQISYKTQDRGRALTATALVAYPSDLAAKSSIDVLLVLHGTAGFTDSCAPSNTTDARPLVAAFASLGYVVVAPDYIGLRGLGEPTGFLHPYLVGQPTALASLDAVRAAGKLLAQNPAPLCTSMRFATVGGSQGGHAALWVDRLAPYYAQELQHVGVVATVPPADLIGEGTRALTAKVPASANMAAFFGAASDWYGVRDQLAGVFVSPLDKDIPAELASTCNPGSSFKDKDLKEVFAKTLLDAAAVPDGLRALVPWGCMVAENGLTTTSVKRLAPKSPGYDVLFVLGESDTLVDPPTEQRSFTTLCQQGMAMQFLECAGASHTKATTWALPEIVDFVRDRFAGKTADAAHSCQLAAPVKCRGTP